MQHEVVIDVHHDLDCVVLRLRGRLSVRSNARVRESIAKSLLGTGRVLIDLSRLRCAQTSFLSVFPAALAVAGGWPSARLVLFGADAALRSALVSARIPETVPLAADLVSARALLEQRPPLVRRHRDLPMHRTAAAAGRMLVREVCTAWLLPQEICEAAELVTNELVSNAVEHAHSSSRLTITYTGAVLRVSVRDYCPMPIPRPRPIDIAARRGRGLHLIAALAQNWSVDRHPDGKTMWASLPVDSLLGRHHGCVAAQTDQPLPSDGVGLSDQ
jgi:anti-sigma regulatory factor (Ser/Thr protein kinase)/anti-anti-sigma regulatory factor